VLGRHKSSSGTEGVGTAILINSRRGRLDSRNELSRHRLPPAALTSRAGVFVLLLTLSPCRATAVVL